MAIKEAKTIFITSVKGGTGKTVTLLNLAGVYEKMKKKVLIIDLDLYAGAIAFCLKLDNENNLYTAIDDVNNNKFNNIENYISKYDEFIDVIPAPKDPRTASKISSKYINIILAKCKMKYDVILIDSNHFMNEVNLSIMDYSDQIVYIINNDPIDLKNMRSMVSIYSDMEINNYKIILNESNNKFKSYYTNYDMKNILGSGIDYIIPSTMFVRNVEKYIINGEIMTLKHQFSGTKILEKIANSLMIETAVEE